MRNVNAALALWVIALAGALPADADRSLDTARIESLTGAKGKLDSLGVFTVSVPRDDLAVWASGVRITPPMGLTSWASFKPTGERTLVMGDLVLLEDQVNPVMSAALEVGLEVTALHHHFFWDSPKVMFMHIAGQDQEERLAAAVGKVFSTMKDTRGGAGRMAKVTTGPAHSLLGPLVDAILGVRGQLENGVYKVVVGTTARTHGEELGAAIGVSTWAAFTGSPRSAVLVGDIAMRESELQGVLKALRGAGINIVAIHQHMTGGEPRMLFLHYWGVGAADHLARGLRSALEQAGGVPVG